MGFTNFRISLFHDVKSFLDVVYEQWPNVDKNDDFLFYFHHPEWIDFAWRYWESYRGSIPLLFLIHNDSEIAGWWPLVLSRRKFGYRLQCLGQEISDYSFPYIRSSLNENCSDWVVDIMQRALNFRKRFNFAFFPAFLYPDSPFTGHTTAEVYDCMYKMNRTGGWLVSEPTRNYFISMPFFDNSFDQYLKQALSRRFRENLNRYVRKSENLGNIEILWIKEKNVLEDLLPLYVKWYRYSSSSHGPCKIDLWKKYYIKKIQENLRFSVLTVNQVPVSFIVGFVRNHQFDLFSLAFDPSFKKYGVGKTHLYHLLKCLFEEGYTALNFLVGDDSYKKHWAMDYYLAWDLRWFHMQSVGGIFYYLKDYLRKKKA